MERPTHIVEEELRRAGLSWTVRTRRHAVYRICVGERCLVYCVSRNPNEGRTMENTRAGIRRIIRQLTQSTAGDNLAQPEKGRNGERNAKDLQAQRQRP